MIAQYKFLIRYKLNEYAAEAETPSFCVSLSQTFSAHLKGNLADLIYYVLAKGCLVYIKR